MIGAGAALGMLAGFILGVVIAVTSRDGIWPQVWAGLILCGAALGAAIGAADMLL